MLLVTIVLQLKFKIKLYNSWKERIIIPLVFFVIGMAWDSFAIYREHWSFKGSGLTGIKIWLLPIEEYLFAIIIPYFIITLYKVLNKKFSTSK